MSIRELMIVLAGHGSPSPDIRSQSCKGEEMLQSPTRTHVENPARWWKAAERAETDGVRVCQLQGSGQWIATSGTQLRTAYEVEVTGNVAHGCACLTGLNGDPVCKHRAAFYLLISALVPPEPEPRSGLRHRLPRLPRLRRSLRPAACTARVALPAVPHL